MTGSSVAGIVTAAASCLIAAGGLVTALTTMIPLLRRTKVLEGKVDGVHKIVNQQRTDAMNYQAALLRALTKAGIEIPEDQSINNG
jgi:hypothetical protein